MKNDYPQYEKRRAEFVKKIRAQRRQRLVNLIIILGLAGVIIGAIVLEIIGK